MDPSTDDRPDRDRPDERQELPTSAEDPPGRTVPNPTAADTVVAWLTLTVPTVIVNLVIYAVADAAGADFTADVGTSTVGIGPGSIIAATSVALLSSTVVWAAVAHRSPGFADLWAWLGWGVGLVSTSLILGVSGATTAVALVSMHLLTTVAAANVLPRVLPRTST